ncbi:MAG: hypothetical protein DMG81_20930 [Acidobacteria bacterium]|nr:MAG: hypothetical protein DMG81_20930 [Acidobacteriota bacterium]
MVVLAVTWMAKVGHESDVAAIFSKLTEASRNEPGCAMYVVHRHKTEPRRGRQSVRTAGLKFVSRGRPRPRNLRS